ncbi:MAG: 50S ribosomal protein L24 [Candidatus Omnitrophica bacterium]|nr:50S ribosomal protein L24 [Candidatus Omnitrophota bacterium]
MLKIKKGDSVQVVKGKDRGKKGKIIRIVDEGKRAVVEGINMVKKHKRRTQQDQQQGGIVSVETPISTANLMFFCKNCSRTVRVGFKILSDNTKVRCCKKCGETI